MKVRSVFAMTCMFTLLTVVTSGCSSSDGKDATPPTAAPVSCAAPGAPAGCWRQILPLGSGGFPPSPGSQNTPFWVPGKFPLTLRPQLAFNDELWMTAQTFAYSSPDGVTWTQHEKTDFGERIYDPTVFFKGKLWRYGGLDYEGRVFLNDIWSSSDGAKWTKVGNAAWPARGSQAMVVFNDKLWLFGGADHIKADRGTDHFLRDVWVSDDGLAWTQVTATAPWAARDDAGAVVFNDALYIVGAQGRADVWRSSDGKAWTQVTPQASWKPRYDYGRVVFDGKLWVFGGWAGEPDNAMNDVWYSSDGATWTRQTDHAAWSPRGPIATAFRDKLWIYSGTHTGADDNWGGDLWQMSKTA